MYDSILIPTDGSQEMAPIVEHAMDLASLCGATVHVIHVIDDRAYYTVPEDSRDGVRETLESDGQGFVDQVAERLQAEEIDTETELVWGDPAASILSYGVEHDIDVVVMGTHGRTGYERYLLGSVAEKVVRVSPVPVLTVAVGDIEQRLEDIKSAPHETLPGAHPDDGKEIARADDGETEPSR